MRRFFSFVLSLLAIYGLVFYEVAVSNPQNSNLPDIRYKPLKGISRLSILIDDLPEGATDIGLKEERLTTIAELKLTKEGILASPEEFEKHLDIPWLYVNINVIGSSFNVYIGVSERVILLRDHSITCEGLTWHNSATGRHGKDSEYIVSALAQLLDDFLNDYYKANPGKD